MKTTSTVPYIGGLIGEIAHQTIQIHHVQRRVQGQGDTPLIIQLYKGGRRYYLQDDSRVAIIPSKALPQGPNPGRQRQLRLGPKHLEELHHLFPAGATELFSDIILTFPKMSGNKHKIVISYRNMGEVLDEKVTKITTVVKKYNKKHPDRRISLTREFLAIGCQQHIPA